MVCSGSPGVFVVVDLARLLVFIPRGIFSLVYDVFHRGLEPVHLVRHLIESFLEHDGLHDNLDDMGSDEEAADGRGVQPLVAFLSTAQYLFLAENTTPDLDGDVNDDQNGGETHEGTHLLVEHLFSQGHGVHLVFPAQFALTDSLATFVEGSRFSQESLIGHEPIFVHLDDPVESVVDQEEAGSEVHDGWVCFLVRAHGAPAGHTSQGKHASVEAVHHDEVGLGAFAKGAATVVWQVLHNVEEAEEVEVVGEEDQQEEHWDHFQGEVHDQKSDQLQQKKLAAK